MLQFYEYNIFLYNKMKLFKNLLRFNIKFDNKPANFRGIIMAIDSMEKRTLKSHIYSEYEDRYQSFAILSMGLMVVGMLMPTRAKQNDRWRGRFVQ